MQLNLDLVRKYNVPGPRYTSYPPATRFTDDTTWRALADELLANNRTERDLSLYFHIPFCQSLCWYCGCTTVITTQQSQSATYLNYLRKEIAQMAADTKLQILKVIVEKLTGVGKYVSILHSAVPNLSSERAWRL